MIMLGSHPIRAREMVLDDILRRRIRLLLVMAVRYLKGTPLGRTQRNAMECNAQFIEAECYSLAEHAQAGEKLDRDCLDDRLCLHLRLLTVLIKSAAMGLPMSDSRRKSMLEYAKHTYQLLDQGEPERYCFLKVA